jgi:polyisoprenyl-phosphate glycosyltransferase
MGYHKETIAIVIPCYNEELNILSIVNEIDLNFAGSEFDHTFIFVDDGSIDNTCLEIRKLSELRKNICLVRLSRNFGKEAAITAGLHQCTSDAAIILDGDLQHPPHLIQDMISEWKKGAYIVDAVKERRNKENIIRKMASAVFNGIFSKLTGIDFAGASDYKLLDKKAIDILNNINEKTRFFRGLTNWIGLPHHKVEFHVEERNAGKTKWSWLNLFHLSVDAVASFSKKPLQVVSILGIFTLLFSLILGIQTLYNKLVGHSVSGFTTVIIVILIVSSIIMISIGIVGIYLSKIYDEVKGRPIYIVDGFENLNKTNEN